MSTLHHQNRLLKGGFFLGNWSLAIFLFLPALPTNVWPQGPELFAGMTLAKAMISGAFIIPSIIADSFINGLQKQRLILLGGDLPAKSSFDAIVGSPRLDLERLKARYPKWPKEPDEQDSMWFKIHKSRSNNDEILLKKHGKTLLLRDLTVMLFFSFFAFIPTFLIGLKQQSGAGVYLSFFGLMLMIVQLFLLRMSAMSTWRDFVEHVLFFESHTELPPITNNPIVSQGDDTIKYVKDEQ